MKTFICLLTIISLSFTFTACGGNTAHKTAIETTIYEDAEDGSVSRWNDVWSGHPILNVAIGANGSSRSIYVQENWERNPDGSFYNENGYYNNNAHYELPLLNKTQFILEFDKMKKEAEILLCFTIGIKVATKDGTRNIVFNPYYEKEGFVAHEQWIMDGALKELVFPISMDYVNDAGVWKHLRFDLVAYLQRFEPNNEITEVLSFYFEGGDDYLDNIRLSSE